MELETIRLENDTVEDIPFLEKQRNTFLLISRTAAGATAFLLANHLALPLTESDPDIVHWGQALFDSYMILTATCTVGGYLVLRDIRDRIQKITQNESAAR